MHTSGPIAGGELARSGTDVDLAVGAREPLAVMGGDLMPLKAAAAADSLVCDKLLEGGRGRAPAADGRSEPHLDTTAAAESWKCKDILSRPSP